MIGSYGTHSTGRLSKYILEPLFESDGLRSFLLLLLQLLTVERHRKEPPVVEIYPLAQCPVPPMSAYIRLDSLSHPPGVLSGKDLNSK